MEIKHISDQLQGYAEETQLAVEHIQKRGYAREQAIEIVKVGTLNMIADAIWYNAKEG